MCIRLARPLKITMYINTHSSCQTFFSPTRHCFVATFRFRCVLATVTHCWLLTDFHVRSHIDTCPTYSRISARIHRNLSDVNHMCLCLAVWQFDGNGEGMGLVDRPTDSSISNLARIVLVFFGHCRCNKLIHIRQWKQNIVDISCESIGFSFFDFPAIGIGARCTGDRD